ncbi:hypothetical protein HMPREF9422_1619 [Streptococcus cristatus ATCC 51100]|uniref:Uncharacterized protein n=1 Tax=Streptococcus cristatus ATCC 51100 TaxID=889201 RepID=A0AAV3EFZ2_STRCR|nr:hypothetical protein [Streptococcus cristatus]EFX52237.1 hypothetical protein HMPREF9422_1619 [Streptococcus cristatus ATCC 51100]EGU68464.1 hypothetical protein HMPREF9960_1033 [Streptococcus cristatus ATCC 51100]KJQ60574.1 hypothetical protein TZ85_00630 [Streptococcus cristatus]SQG33108.1 Uncharacterised protein [Streptococcus cristatus ATCC 51100]
MGKRNLEALRQKHQSKFKKAQTKKPANSQPSFLSKWKTKEDKHIKPSAGLQEAQGRPEENQPRPSVSSPSKVAFPIESSSNELSAVSSIEDKTGYGAKPSPQDQPVFSEQLEGAQQVKEPLSLLSQNLLELKQRELKRLISSLESLKAKKQNQVLGGNQASQPVSGLVEPKQTKLSPRISSNELAREIDKVEFKKKKLGIFSKIWVVILFVLGIIASMYDIVEQWKKNDDLKRMEEAAAISRMLDSYIKDQDLKSANRPEWIAKKEKYQFHISYDDVTSLFSDFTSSVPNLTTVDEVVAKLGKAESGKEIDQDDPIKTIDLDYSQAGTEAKVSLSFKSHFGSSETPKLQSLKCAHLSSAHLPNRNAQLTRQELTGIEKGKTYQEIVSQLGLPERLDWNGGIFGNATLSIYYRLEDGQEVGFSFENNKSQSYQLTESSGLGNEAGDTGAQ